MNHMQRVLVINGEQKGCYGIVIGTEKISYTIDGKVIEGAKEESYYYIGGFATNPLLLIRKKYNQLEFVD